MVYTTKNDKSKQFSFKLKEESLKDIFKNLSSLANDIENISDDRTPQSWGGVPDGSLNKDSQDE